MAQIEELGISNTDISEGAEHLPDDITRLYYSTEARPNRLKLKNPAWLLNHEDKKKVKEEFQNFQSNYENLGILSFEDREVGVAFKIKVKESNPAPVLSSPPLEEETKLSKEVVEQIKDFPSNWYNLGPKLDAERKLLVKKLIPNKKLRKRYKIYGLCLQCHRPKTGGNCEIDKFIQETQLEAVNNQQKHKIVQCYGISQDPRTKNYIMVMQYMLGGNLREFLNKRYDSLDFEEDKQDTAKILGSFITDLGLCRPINENDKEKIFGVLPYVAPEVLRKESHTQSSDIYSFGIIMYEILSGLPPYADLTYDQSTNLVLKICQGLRPNLSDVIAPQLVKDLVSRCWDADPAARPATRKNETKLYQQFKELEELYKETSENIGRKYKNYPSANCISRLLDFKSLPKPQNSKEININKQFYINQEIKQIEERFEFLKKPLENELKKLVEKFIEIKKESLKNKEDKQVKKQARELKKQLGEKGLEKKIDEEVIRCCENLVELEQQLEKEELRMQVEITTNK
ncbi:5976_t:CDS:2 [Ambispora gerdemannii]|uniref:5976_t:CDS:1 n=1 Tax=Ambispora gerdemannii TaxID=144530 RepID=A0A9N8ZL68_9GLOM|nr:5976_t:CDS:2 [Ambispora gerdemannii]